MYYTCPNFPNYSFGFYFAVIFFRFVLFVSMLFEVGYVNIFISTGNPNSSKKHRQLAPIKLLPSRSVNNDCRHEIVRPRWRAQWFCRRSLHRLL